MTQTPFRRFALAGFASILALAAAPVLAQTSSPGAPSAPSAQPPASSGTSTRDASDQRTSPADLGGQSVDKMMGKTVYNAEGKKVGDIEDFVVDNAASPGAKQITYAVIGVGGFLGLGEKQVAIPATELQSSGDRIQLSSNMTEDQLKQLPSYDRSKYRSIARNNSGDSGTTTRGDMPGRSGTTTGSPAGTSPSGGTTR